MASATLLSLLPMLSKKWRHSCCPRRQIPLCPKEKPPRQIANKRVGAQNFSRPSPFFARSTLPTHGHFRYNSFLVMTGSFYVPVSFSLCLSVSLCVYHSVVFFFTSLHTLLYSLVSSSILTNQHFSGRCPVISSRLSPPHHVQWTQESSKRSRAPEATWSGEAIPLSERQ